MSFLFKKWAKKEPFQEANIQDKIAAGIVHKCISVQTKWAEYMQRKTEKLSLKTVKYGLIFFCLLSVACSLYLIIGSFSNGNKQHFVSVPISIPAHSMQTGDERSRSLFTITKAEFNRIERFRHYMDSLGESPQTAPMRDSILSNRPGLMDSVRFIEKLYELQNIKK